MRPPKTEPPVRKGRRLFCAPRTQAAAGNEGDWARRAVRRMLNGVRQPIGRHLMSFTAAALRELHRIHRQLADLRERLDRGPKQIKARQGAVTTAEERLAKVHADFKASRVAV